MNNCTLVFRSLRFYSRTHLGVLAGCAISAAVLVGALFIGDSARGSLERTALARLGRVHQAIDTGPRYFREDLARKAGGAAVLRVKGMALTEEKQVNRVDVLGVDGAFFKFAESPPGIDLAPGEVALNDKLAAALGMKTGEEVSLRMFQPGLLSRDAPLVSRNEKTTRRRLLTVVAVLSDAEFGRFSLRSDQARPYNAFVNLGWLQETLELEGWANVLLAGADPTPIRKIWTLQDAALTIRKSGDIVQLESSRIYLDPAVSDDFPKATGSLTYLVNSISAGGKSTPYSFVTALTPGGLGPVPADMNDSEIIVNRWLERHLGIENEKSPELTVAYSEWTAENRFVEKTRVFRVRRVDEPDPEEKNLVPDFPGLTNVDSCRDWDIGITTDEAKLRDKANEKYWEVYRQTPKAFVTLKAGQEMWANRYGNLMALRFPASGFMKEKIRERIDPAKIGLAFRPVRREAMKAADDSMDLGQLFLGLSFFLIAASLLLTAMLFVFTIEQRAEEIGVLRAVGHTPWQVRRLFLAEGLVLAVMGSLAGVPLGWAFAQSLIFGLDTVWNGAVAGASIDFHPKIASAVIGAASATLVSALAMSVAMWRRVKSSIRGLVSHESQAGSRFGWIWWVVFLLSTCGGVGVAVWALLSSETGKAGMFFFAGALILTGGIAMIRLLLSRKPTGRFNLRTFGYRNAYRRRGRGMATAGMLACGCFMVLSVSSMKQDFSQDAGRRDSGTGGFELLAQSSIPTKDIRMKDVSVLPIRVHGGDDASCLNLNRAATPPLLGVDPAKLAKLGAFDGQWELLNEPVPDGVIPAIVGDSATAMWNLKKKVGKEDGALLDYRDERGRPFKIKLVAALPMRLSVFQGRLLISNRHFTQLYPSESGYRMFLMDVPKGNEQQVMGSLTKKFEKEGLDVVPSVGRLQEYYEVESTYLMMFLVLGGLGLLLGTVGMGILILRNVLERRSELALLQSVGYSRAQVGTVVMAEHLFLVGAGILVGTCASALAMGPSLVRPEVRVPFGLLAGFLIGTTVLSLAWIWISTRLALRAPLIPALRNE